MPLSSRNSLKAAVEQARADIVAGKIVVHDYMQDGACPGLSSLFCRTGSGQAGRRSDQAIPGITDLPAPAVPALADAADLRRNSPRNRISVN